VLMIAPLGTDYQWIGPNNAVIGSVQSIYATTPGFYFVQFVNTGGCFLVSNEVEVRGFNSPYMFAEPQQTICEGGTVTLTVVANENSILDWSGNLLDNVFEQDIYQAGYYEVAATFCGITDTVSVTVIDVSPEVDLNIAGFDTICAGEILHVQGPPGYYSYNWSTGSQDPDIEVTQPGMYFLTAENLDGCIGHSDTLFVEVNAAPAPPLLSDTTICYSGSAISLVLSNTGSVYWFDQQLDSLGILTQIASDSVTASLAYYGAHYNGECFSLFDTASVSLFSGSILPQITGDQVLCSNDSLLLEATTSSVLTYSWLLPDLTIVNGNQLALANPDSGIYLLLAEHPVCGVDTISHSLAMVQTDAFVIDFTIGDSLNCIGDLVQLTVLGNYSSIEWQPSTSNSGSIDILEDGILWASIEDTNGCDLFSDTVQIQFQEPPLALTVPTDTICQGTMAELLLVTSNNLLLDDGTDLIPSTNPFSTATLSSDTIYTFVLTDELGCNSDPFSWNIEVTQTPEEVEVFGDTLLCDGDELLLSASPIGVGAITFFDQFGDSLGIANSNGEFLIDSVSLGLPSGGAFATLNIEGCLVESDLLEIEVLPIPENPILIVIGNGCPDDTVFVHAADTAGLSHFWVGPNGFTLNEPLLVFDPIEPNEQGVYSLYVEQSICASDTSSVTIMLAPVPDVMLIPDSIICAGDFVELILDQSYNQMLWSTGEMSEMITVTDSGSYWVLVTNEFGCQDSDTTLIQAVTCQVSVSNIITPNNDGYNDFFKLEAEGLVEVNVKIFNRFGRLIYQWDVIDGAWDGSIQNNGLNAQAGTYYYVASYMDLSSESGIKKGYIQLSR
jgi:gliding motility-associated-like protein